MLVWFHAADVYHRHFADAGLIVLAYNCFRVLFVFYLFWMVATAGLALLRTLAAKALEEIGSLERLALGFFTGAAVWHVALLALGYLDLYTVPAAVVMTLPLVALSYTDARAAFRSLHEAVAGGDALARNLGSGSLCWLVLGLSGAAFAALLLVKGLYPGGGHDYYTHYFYYFEAVIHQHGLWPNNVWYHYYYDKGAGLFFLGILIADPLAPQLVTFTFMAAAALALYLTLRRIAPGTLWPLVGVAMFFGIYVCTPGSAFLYRANGGWGEFQKTHEIIAALVVAAFWMTVELLSTSGRLRLLWSIGAAAAVICAVVVNITEGVFFGGQFALLALFYAARRRFEPAIICAGLGAAAGTVLVATLLLNQLTTGLANDQGILLFWRFANIDKLAQWGALPLLMALLHERRTMMASDTPLLSFDSLVFVVQSFRLDLVAPMIIGGIAVAMPSLLRRRWNRAIAAPLAVMAAAVLTFVAIALVAGRAQQVSFYRYGTFATALAITSGVLLWNLANPEGALSRFARIPAVAVAVMAICAVASAYPRLTLRSLDHAVRFAAGGYSIDTAYQRQTGVPASAIYPGARGAYEVAGAGTPIWSLHPFTYCMLPDCLVESYFSFIMARDLDRIMFGQPQQAKQTLQAAGLNYFLFSREFVIRDPLPRSALFAPDNIARYLGIRWTDGTTALLTWLGPDVQPLDAGWLAAYRAAVERSQTAPQFPYQEIKDYLARLRAATPAYK